MWYRVRGFVAACLVMAACSSGGVAIDAPSGSTPATAPTTAAAPTFNLCALLAGVADDVDRVDETAPPSELEQSLGGVVAFVQSAAEVAPPAVAADVEIVTGLYEALVVGLESAGWDWGAFTASDHALRVADLRAEPATGVALEAISGWSRTNC